MVKISRYIVYIFFCLFSLNLCASSNLKKIENYFKNLKSLKSDFVQVSSDGSLSCGSILIARPQKFRIEYESPSNDLIISDGNRIALINKKINSISFYSLDQIPFKVIISENFTFDNYEILESKNENNVVSVKLTEKIKNQEQAIKIIFEKSPFRLRKWNVIDQERITQVTLSNLQINIDLKNKNFIISDPRKYPFSTKD